MILDRKGLPRSAFDTWSGLKLTRNFCIEPRKRICAVAKDSVDDRATHACVGLVSLHPVMLLASPRHETWNAKASSSTLSLKDLLKMISKISTLQHNLEFFQAYFLRWQFFLLCVFTGLHCCPTRSFAVKVGFISDMRQAQNTSTLEAET